MASASSVTVVKMDQGGADLRTEGPVGIGGHDPARHPRRLMFSFFLRHVKGLATPPHAVTPPDRQS